MRSAQAHEGQRTTRRLTTVSSPTLHQTSLARAGGSSGGASPLLTPPDKPPKSSFQKLILRVPCDFSLSLHADKTIQYSDSLSHMFLPSFISDTPL